MNRVRRTLAVVRASTPAVRSIVFSMRMKAAAAKEVVARRHRTQAADLIHTALRVSHCSSLGCTIRLDCCLFPEWMFKFVFVYV